MVLVMFAYHRDVVRPSCDVTRHRTTTWINCWLIAQCSCDVAGRKILSKGISYDDVRWGITMTCVVVWLQLHHILLSIIVDHRRFWPSWAIIDQRTLCGPKALPVYIYLLIHWLAGYPASPGWMWEGEEGGGEMCKRWSTLDWCL